MTVEVRVPAVLQRMVGGAKSLQIQGGTVAEVLDRAEALHPGFKSRLTTEEGKLHQFVNIYLNDEDIRFLKELKTPVKDGDVISILPAVAGG